MWYYTACHCLSVNMSHYHNNLANIRSYLKSRDLCVFEIGGHKFRFRGPVARVLDNQRCCHSNHFVSVWLGVAFMLYLWPFCLRSYDELWVSRDDTYVVNPYAKFVMDTIDRQLKFQIFTSLDVKWPNIKFHVSNPKMHFVGQNEV